MKNKKTNFTPIKVIASLVFLMAFMLNIQTSFNGEWDLVNVGYAEGTGDDGDPGSFMEMKREQCPDGESSHFVCRAHEWRGCSVEAQTVCETFSFSGESFIN